MSSLRVVMLLIFAVPSLVKADWPAHRHDAARSATGDGSSRMTQPVITWRHYLGGTLGSDQIVTFDVAGDSGEELLLLSGGKLVAKTPDDVLVWQSPLLELLRISGMTDLDGDGAQEVVVGGRDRVHVVSAANGKVLWSLPAGTIGALGAVRFADFNHDSHPDGYVADAACGSVGSLGDVAEIWSFATGANAPTRLFQLERRRRDYVCGPRCPLHLSLSWSRDSGLPFAPPGPRKFSFPGLIANTAGSDFCVPVSTPRFARQPIPHGHDVRSLRDEHTMKLALAWLGSPLSRRG